MPSNIHPSTKIGNTQYQMRGLQNQQEHHIILKVWNGAPPPPLPVAVECKWQKILIQVVRTFVSLSWLIFVINRAHLYHLLMTFWLETHALKLPQPLQNFFVLIAENWNCMKYWKLILCRSRLYMQREIVFLILIHLGCVKLRVI